MELGRYHRQIILKEFGAQAQAKLASSKVLVIGAGGLGCPAMLYLAAAGVGTLGIVDFDVVDMTNLHRQVLYTMQDIGHLKADVAARRLLALNPDILVQPYRYQLTNRNILTLLAEYDIVIDGSDNYATRYMVNDACVLSNKALVYGAVMRFDGHVGVFNLADATTGNKANYRDLYPQPPDASLSASCSEIGVLGVLPGMIGVMQATETIKIIAGIGKVLCNRILSYNALHNTFHEFDVSSNHNSQELIPKSRTAFEAFDYQWFCNHLAKQELSTEDFDILRATQDIVIIDVRNHDELPIVPDFQSLRIPLSEFADKVHDLSASEKIVFVCQSGQRSLKALSLFLESNPQAVAYSMKGGIGEWLQQHGG